MEYIAKGFSFIHAFSNQKVSPAVHSNIHSIMVCNWSVLAV